MGHGDKSQWHNLYYNDNMIGWSHDRQRLLIWIELEVLPKYVDFIEIDFEKTLPG